MATIHIIHGFIGSGKTTFAKKLEKEIKAIRFTHDEWLHTLYGPEDSEDFHIKHERIKKMIWSIADRLLELGQDVIIDFGFWSRQSRDEIRAKSKEMGVNIKIYYTYCPTDLALKRTMKRTKNIPEDSMEISKETFKILLKQFEPVGDDEEYILIKSC